MKTIVKVGKGLFLEFEDEKSMGRYFKKFLKESIFWGPWLIFMSLMLGILLVALFAGAVYLFLSHIDFFLFDIPIMIFDFLLGE